MGLSSLALALSAFLSWHYLTGGSVIGCTGRSPCDQVLSSRWSTIAGVLPISGLAAGAYLAILLASLSLSPATPVPVRRLAWKAMLVLAGAAAGSAVWFIIVQKWMIGAFCPLCMATHITGLLLTALVFWLAPRQFENDSTDLALKRHSPNDWDSEIRNPKYELSSKCQETVPETKLAGPFRAFGFWVLSLFRISDFGFRIWALVGLSFAVILAACQVVFAPPAVYRSGKSQNELTAIDPHSAPLVGPPDAPYIVTVLFDYKCSHCQQLHFMLDEAVRRYGGKLGFVLCPAPLNTQCNPYVPRDVDEFKDSCELAKVALSVWVARRDVFPAFNHWMFSLESGDRWKPRSVETAQAKAVELVTQAKFEAARMDTWIDRYLQTSIRIYGETGSNAVPKLVFGSRWVNPKPNGTDDLVSILHNSLAVPAP